MAVTVWSVILMVYPMDFQMASERVIVRGRKSDVTSRLMKGDRDLLGGSHRRLLEVDSRCRVGGGRGMRRGCRLRMREGGSRGMEGSITIGQSHFGRPLLQVWRSRLWDNNAACGSQGTEADGTVGIFTCLSLVRRLATVSGRVWRSKLGDDGEDCCARETTQWLRRKPCLGCLVDTCKI